jgi:hypothetical protein
METELHLDVDSKILQYHSWNLDGIWIVAQKTKMKKNSNLFGKNLTLLCNIDGDNTKNM